MQLLKLFQRSRPAPAPHAPSKRDLATKLRAGMGSTFSASRNDNTTSMWDSTPRDPDDILSEHRRLVARSRQQCLNNDYAKAYLRMVRQNVVGENGVVLQARSQDANGVLDDAANAAIETAWDDWGQVGNCDVTGLLHWLDVQETQINHAASDGEFFLQFVYGEDAGPYGFAVRPIDPQRCPPDLHQDNLPNGKFIRGGIEFNRFGRPLAYFFSFETRNGSYAYTTTSLERVPASDIVHGFLRERIGLRRGIPWTTTGLYRLRHLQGFEEASVINARVAASKMGFIEYEDGYGPDLDDDEELHVVTEPGTIQELPQGARYKGADHGYPAGEYTAFTKGQLRGASAGFGVPYNDLANDLENVNFSSIRQGALDAREHWKLLQGWYIRTLIAPVFERWLRYALLSQKILVKGRPLKPELLAKYRRVSWQGRRWAWIDPKSEVEAAVIAKNNLLTSPGQVIREQGRDPQAVWQEIAADIAAMQAAGIPEVFIQQALGQKLGGGAPPSVAAVAA